MSIPASDPADRAEQSRDARPGNDDLEAGARWPADLPEDPETVPVPDEADPADVAEQRLEVGDDDDDAPRP